MTDNAIDGRRCAVLVAVQQVLLGEVTPNLRAVTVEYDDVRIRLEAFFDRDPDDDEVEAMSLVETELVALFPESHEISLKLTTWREPAQVPKDRPWAYHRKEPLLA